MSTKWFEPRDLLFKSPFGAVPCGAEVSFSFRPERGAAVTRCELLAHGEFADQWTTVELTPAQEDGHVGYRGSFTAPDDVERVWYHFRLSWADGGTSCYTTCASVTVAGVTADSRVIVSDLTRGTDAVRMVAALEPGAGVVKLYASSAPTSAAEFVLEGSQ